MLIINRKIGQSIYINDSRLELLDIRDEFIEIEYEGKHFSMVIHRPIMLSGSEVTLLKSIKVRNFKTGEMEYTARFGFINIDVKNDIKREEVKDRK